MVSQALLKAVSAGRSRQVRLLLDSGFSVDTADDCGQTALIRSIFLDQDKTRDRIIKHLLIKGAQVGKADMVGRNALSWACLYGRYINISTLLEFAELDFDLNTMDVNGQTPLFHAVTSGSAAAVKLMVLAIRKYDLSVDIQDVGGNSPLIQAVKLGHDLCASILVQYGKAKVGLGMKYPDDYATVEKWAIQSLRDRERISNGHKYKFPPILELPERTCKEKYEGNAVYRGNRTKDRFQRKDSDSDSESSADESDIISVASSKVAELTNNTFNLLLGQGVPPLGLSSSIFAVSPCSSTVVNASSEDEVDFSSTPITDHKTQSLNTLNKMYDLKQEQMSSSFRPTVYPPPTPPDPPTKESTSTTLYSEKSYVSCRSLRKGKRWNACRNKSSMLQSMLKRQGTGDSLFDELSAGSPFPEANADNSPGSGITSPEKRVTPCLPSISSKKTSLIRTHVLQDKSTYSTL